MPRRPRVHLDWLPLRIAQRGHNRGAWFFDDKTGNAYLPWLHGALRRERCRLHAYVPMTDHAHLLLTRQEARSVPPVLIALEDAPPADFRLALNRHRPLGSDRVYAEIEGVTGQRREPRKRGRPSKRSPRGQIAGCHCTGSAKW